VGRTLLSAALDFDLVCSTSCHRTCCEEPCPNQTNFKSG
jgi:hypothetical protein